MRHVTTLILCAVATTAFAGHELDGRDLANGQRLYAVQCALCHGGNLQGQPNWQTPGEDGILPAPPHDETGHTWHHDNQLLFAYTKRGGRDALAERGITNFNSGMPGFDGLISDSDIWDILAFIRSKWPDRMQEMQAFRNPPHDKDG